MARFLVIFNPVAGRGRGATIAPLIESELRRHGHQIRIHATNHKGHARQIAASDDAHWSDGVISCGGDGTLGEVINGRRDLPIPVGLVPLGTGNVLAKELGIPRRFPDVLEPILRWRLRTIDLGETSAGRRFSCMVSAGVDGRIIQLLEEHRAGGTMSMWQYLPLGLSALRDANYAPIDVQVDGRSLGHRVGYACIANTHSFGGPIEMISGARVDDGVLNLLACRFHIPTGFPTLLGLAMLRMTRRMPGTSFHTASTIRLQGHGPKPVPYQIDGEFGGVLPIEVRVMPMALAVFAPDARR